VAGRSTKPDSLFPDPGGERQAGTGTLQPPALQEKKWTLLSYLKQHQRKSVPEDWEIIQRAW